jgi:hypothetical protein
MSVSLSDLQRMATASYSYNPPKNISNYQLVASTPTLKIYVNGYTAIVAVRGTETTNREDLQADAEALRGRLGQSNRARKDLDFMMNFKRAYPNYQYIGVGHSLGGAILDLFLQAHLISRAISYNPLVQPQDLGGNPLHHRIYHEGDFLYKLFGYKIPGIEVRKTKNSMWSMLFNQTIPFYDSLKNHQLDTFIGGAY